MLLHTYVSAYSNCCIHKKKIPQTLCFLKKISQKLETLQKSSPQKKVPSKTEADGVIDTANIFRNPGRLSLFAKWKESGYSWGRKNLRVMFHQWRYVPYCYTN